MYKKIAEMKAALLQLISSQQFASMDRDDPYSHLDTFYELCGTAGLTRNNEEALLLRLFPLSMTGKAKAWLQSKANQSLTRWKDVETQFLSRFFPPSKNTELKAAIVDFVQRSDEPLCEVWERYKVLLRKCPLTMDLWKRYRCKFSIMDSNYILI